MNPEQQAKKYKRISQTTAILMVTCAVFYDVLELAVDWIPAVGQILAFFIDLFAIMHFAFWFMLCRVKLTSPKRVARFWLPMLGEMLPIPVIDAFIMTLGIILTIRSVWEKDGESSKPKSGIKKMVGKLKKAA